MNFVGVDYHKRYSVATVMNQDGEVLAQQRLANTRDAFRVFLEPFEDLKAAVEATRNWVVPVEILEQLTDDVRLGNPYLIKAIARHKFGGSDRIDSHMITKLLQLDWLPESYLRGKANRDQQIILRLRCFLVQQRTRLKNRIFDLIDRQPEGIREHTRDFSDLLGKKGLTWLKSLQLGYPCQAILDQMLAVYEALDQQIRKSDGMVAALNQTDPNCQLIGSVPGFGPFFSVLVNVEIGTIGRFPNSSQLCSYAGLVPWTESSGGKIGHGPTRKQSNHWLRWAFVEAVTPAVVADDGLRSYYEYYRRLKGTKTAKVVIGRRLCSIVYRVLRQQRPYYKQKPRVNVSWSGGRGQA